MLFQLEEMISQGKHKKYKDLVYQIEPSMLKDVTAALFELSMNHHIGYDYTKEKLDTAKRKKKAGEGFTRLFLTIGTIDRIKKGHIIDFITGKANIRKDDIQGIDIKRKFTFVNINDKVVKRVITKCAKQKLKNRKIDIEVANTR